MERSQTIGACNFIMVCTKTKNFRMHVDNKKVQLRCIVVFVVKELRKYAPLFARKGSLMWGHSLNEYSAIFNIMQYRVTKSLKCSAYRRCCKYILNCDLTHVFSGLGKDNCKTRRETFKFCDLLSFILQVWISFGRTIFKSHISKCRDYVFGI